MKNVFIVKQTPGILSFTSKLTFIVKQVNLGLISLLYLLTCCVVWLKLFFYKMQNEKYMIIIKSLITIVEMMFRLIDA